MKRKKCLLSFDDEYCVKRCSLFNKLKDRCLLDTEPRPHRCTLFQKKTFKTQKAEKEYEKKQARAMKKSIILGYITNDRFDEEVINKITNRLDELIKTDPEIRRIMKKPKKKIVWETCPRNYD